MKFGYKTQTPSIHTGPKQMQIKLLNKTQLLPVSSPSVSSLSLLYHAVETRLHICTHDKRQHCQWVHVLKMPAVNKASERNKKQLDSDFSFLTISTHCPELVFFKMNLSNQINQSVHICAKFKKRLFFSFPKIFIFFCSQSVCLAYTQISACPFSAVALSQKSN